MAKDKQRREVKKPKKGAKKESISTIVAPTEEVQLIRKIRKPKEEEEE